MKIILSVFVCLFLASCNTNKDIDIMIYNEAQKEYLNDYILFKNYGIKVIDNDNYITLKKINKDILMEVLYLLDLKIDIIENSIVNVNTTRTNDGGPFIRNYLSITTENGIEILKDLSSTRLVYDPTHPDAIFNGENKGYVQFSNVDLRIEYNDLIETIRLYNGIVDYIKNNYKQTAIGKINIMRIGGIENNGI
jgi:flagellar basal-body rod protein FlgC